MCVGFAAPGEVGPDRAPTCFWTPVREGPIRSLLYVWDVCVDVTKINFVNFLKIGSYDFF